MAVTISTSIIDIPPLSSTKNISESDQIFKQQTNPFVLFRMLIANLKICTNLNAKADDLEWGKKYIERASPMYT